MTVKERPVVEKARQFDLIQLVMALEELNYPFSDIVFRSHYSNGSRASIVESVEFGKATRQALVTLNLGLLGGQSPLPSYFFRKVDQGEIDEWGFVEFIGALDAILLRHFLTAACPEADPCLRANLEEGRRDWLRTQRLTTLAALHWMVQLVFPELCVRVEKAPFRQLKRLRAPVLGRARLSRRTVFGGTVEVPILGRRITLVSDEEETLNGTPWVKEITARLKRLVLPLLNDTGIHLEVWLVVRHPGRGVELALSSYLGYRVFPAEGTEPEPIKVRVFSEYLSESARTSHLINTGILLEDWRFAGARGRDLPVSRLDEIENLADHGGSIEAAVRSQAILAEGILDVRLVCFLLSGAVCERGLVGLADALPALQTLLQRHWEVLSPSQEREKHLATYLSRLLRQSFEKTLRYEEERRSARWAAWTAELDREFLFKLAGAIEKLRVALQERLGSAEGPLFERLDTLRAWLDRVGDQFDAPAP